MGHQLGVEAACDGDRVEGPVGSDDAVKGTGASLGDEVGAILGGRQQQAARSMTPSRRILRARARLLLQPRGPRGAGKRRGGGRGRRRPAKDGKGLVNEGDKVCHPKKCYSLCHIYIHPRVGHTGCPDSMTHISPGGTAYKRACIPQRSQFTIIIIIINALAITKFSMHYVTRHLAQLLPILKSLL